MDYPSYDDYQIIYSRFFKRSPAELLEIAGVDLTEAKVLDLCGGNGRLSFLAAQRGARVTYVDESPMMAPITDLQNKGIEVYIRTVTAAVHKLASYGKKFDVVACQQGVNYWFDIFPLSLISKLLTTKSSLVFNTFNRRPSSAPTVKEYHLNDKRYAEVSYCGGDNIVHHVQCCQGFPPHVTSFRWIGPDKIRAYLLTSGFSRIEETLDDATTIWKAQL